MTAGEPSAPVPRRLAAQLLSGTPARTVLQVAGRLLAIQAQDARGARLAIRARSHGLSAADVDSALTSDRSVMVTWLNRGTLHLVRAEDYWWLHPLTAPPLRTGNARRLAEPVSDQCVRVLAAHHRAAHRDAPQARQRELVHERLALCADPGGGDPLTELRTGERPLGG